MLSARISKYIVTVLCLSALQSCNDIYSESGGQTASGSDAKANSWIRSVMAEWYLWNDEIESIPTSKLNYAQDYQTFFKKLIGNLDGNAADGGYSNGVRYFYSYVERETVTRTTTLFEPTFGMGIIFTGMDSYNSKLFGRVSYVYKDSPAYEAGIRRGMWLSKIDAEDITYFNYTKIISPSDGLRITVSQANVTTTGNTVTATGRSYDITARRMALSPCLTDTVFNIGGKKIGYMAYLRFDRGYQGYASTEYEQELKDVFAAFKAEGIDEFILDMRYNPGGYNITCRLLASLIVRNDHLGQVYAKTEYNTAKKRIYGTPTETFDLDVAAQNIDMSKIYVLATNHTASAAETIINALRGADVEVIHIGTRTEGKNVGMTLFEKNGCEGYDYDLWPITFRVYNAKGESNYDEGFVPNYTVDESNPAYNGGWKDLGESGELLTATAIEIIKGNTAISQDVTRSYSVMRQSISSSDFCTIKGIREVLER